MTDQINFNGKDLYSVKTVEVTYRKDSKHKWAGRIYLPEQKGHFPGLIDVHGGPWSGGRYTDNEKIDRFLASKGIAVFAIECKKAPDYNDPAQMMDLNLAIRWLKTHAEEFNILPDQIDGIGAPPAEGIPYFSVPCGWSDFPRIGFGFRHHSSLH